MPTASDLHAIFYLSSAVRPFTQREITSIANHAGKNNSRDAVTGITLYYEGSICQVLEGNRDVVHATFERISANPMHKNILKLYDAPIEERSFSSWAIAYRPLKTLPVDQQKSLVDIRALTSTPNFQSLQASAPLMVLVRSFLSGFGPVFADVLDPRTAIAS